MADQIYHIDDGETQLDDLGSDISATRGNLRYSARSNLWESPGRGRALTGFLVIRCVIMPLLKKPGLNMMPLKLQLVANPPCRVVMRQGRFAKRPYKMTQHLLVLSRFSNQW